LDFRGEEGGGGLQILNFALSMGSATLIIFMGLRQLLVLPGTRLILLWGAYLGFSLAVVLVREVNLRAYFGNMLPVLLLFTSMCVTQIASGAGLRWQQVLHPMLIGAAINIVWRVVYMVVIRGTALEEVRVQILSQSLPFFLAWALCKLILEKEFSKYAAAAVLLGVSVYFLSITRSAFIVLGVEILVLLWLSILASRWKRLPQGWGRAKQRQALLGAGGLIMAAGVLLAAVPSALERWQERLFNPVGSDYLEEDPSKLTRLAETRDFYERLESTPTGWIYGMGVGHEYGWHEAYHPDLGSTYGNIDQFRQEVGFLTFPGHSIWTYAIFSGGIIGGLFYLLLFLYGLVLAWRAFRLVRELPEFPLTIAALPLVAQLGFLSLSLTFNPFIERGATICLGVMLLFPQFILLEAWRKQNQMA
jgi:hypothetical protein